ncbi:hypothetical protein BJX64DRAFT_285894 [Aspergillus heterothallicus]
MFRLFGNFWLPPPEIHLTPGELDHLNSLMPSVRHLDNEERIATQSRLYDMREEFRKFKIRETQAWIVLGVKRPSEFLVAPAGALDSPVACHLHNPTFHVSNPLSSITDDISNPTISQLYQVGFSSKHCLIFDHVSRRDDTASYLAFYPEKIREIHEEFTFNIRSKMGAVVEICWGLHVKKRMLQCVKLVPLPLWGEYRGVTLFLELHADKSTAKLIRFVVFVYHPNFFVYRSTSIKPGQNWRHRFGREQDLLLAVAAKLGGIAIKEGFYEYLHNPRSYGRLTSQQSITKDRLSAQALEELRIAAPEAFAKLEPRRVDYFDGHDSEAIPAISEMVPTISTEAGSFQNVFPREVSYDADIFRLQNSLAEVDLALTTECLLPQTIAIHLAVKFSELTSILEFEYLPEALVQWIRNQDGLKIDGKPISTADELVLSFKLLHRFRETQVPRSLIETAYAVALAYAYNMSKTRKSSISDLMVPATELRYRVMRLKCRKCKKRVLDNCFSYYSLKDPRVYVCQTLEAGCGQLGCTGRTALIPVDDSQKYIMSRRTELESLPQTHDAEWTRYIVRSRTEAKGLPEVVEVSCHGCKEQRGLANTQRDTRPRWTIEDSPRYLVPRRRCQVCGALTYWRPIDETLPRIDTPSIARIWASLKRKGLDLNKYPRLPGLFFGRMSIKDRVESFQEAKRRSDNQKKDQSVT